MKPCNPATLSLCEAVAESIERITEGPGCYEGVHSVSVTHEFVRKSTELGTGIEALARTYPAEMRLFDLLYTNHKLFHVARSGYSSGIFFLKLDQRLYDLYLHFGEPFLTQLNAALRLTT